MVLASEYIAPAVLVPILLVKLDFVTVKSPLGLTYNAPPVGAVFALKVQFLILILLLVTIAPPRAVAALLSNIVFSIITSLVLPVAYIVPHAEPDEPLILELFNIKLLPTALIAAPDLPLPILQLVNVTLFNVTILFVHALTVPPSCSVAYPLMKLILLITTGVSAVILNIVADDTPSIV